MSLLEIEDLVKSFPADSSGRQMVVDVPAFRLEEGEQVALHGTSGSGKTTLLHLISGILRPDRGSVRIGGVDIARLSESQRDAFRARNLGYMFQSFHLLQGHSALENVLIGMAFGAGADRGTAVEMLTRLGLLDRLQHLPRQLSVGQQQRVALARAIAHRPRLVLADEPTGNLDPRNARDALTLLREVCRERNAALLLVSHDPSVLQLFERRVDLTEISRGTAASATGARG